MMRAWLKLLVVAAFGLLAVPSFAWNAAGHMATGLMAYQELQATQPQVVAKIMRLMQSHPTPALFAAAAIPDASGLTEAERTFMAMTTWADEVRAPEYAMLYHHDSWHWINLVYVPPGTSGFTAPAEIVESRVFAAFASNVAIVRDEKASDAEKAVALCWIFHLVGDIHQPLHTTALFNATFPEGDRGGNSIPLRVISTGGTTNLHSFWDGVVAWNTEPKAVGEVARSLTQTYPKYSLRLLGEKPYMDAASFERWGREESAPLAISSAYENGKILNFHKDDTAYLLSSAYVAQARAVANERVALAGYRLAEVLRALFAH